MVTPSAEQRLLRGLVELQDAAGLGDETDLQGGSPTTRPATTRPATTRPATTRPATTRPATARLWRYGPISALVLPGLLGVLSWRLLAGDGTAARGVLGLACAVLAAPLLAVAGIPLRSGSTLVALAIAGSIVVWLGLGGWAARRAVRSSTPTWARFAVELLWMVIAVWCGLALAALASNLVLGRPLL